jgi:hypothetical protein
MLIDRIRDKLPVWKAAMMHLAGRATLVHAVLTSILFISSSPWNFLSGLSKPLTRFGELFFGKVARRLMEIIALFLGIGLRGQLKIIICGCFLHPEISREDQPIVVSSWGLLSLSLCKKFGNLGLRLIADFHLVGLTKLMLDC